MASAKMASAFDVRIDDVGSILKFRIGFPFGENSAGFCQSVWLPGSIVNLRPGSEVSKRSWRTEGVAARKRFKDQKLANPLPPTPFRNLRQVYSNAWLCGGQFSASSARIPE